MDFKEAQHISYSEKKGRKLKTVDCNTDIVFPSLLFIFPDFKIIIPIKKYIYFSSTDEY